MNKILLQRILGILEMGGRGRQHLRFTVIPSRKVLIHVLVSWTSSLLAIPTSLPERDSCPSVLLVIYIYGFPMVYTVSISPFQLFDRIICLTTQIVGRSAPSCPSSHLPTFINFHYPHHTHENTLDPTCASSHASRSDISHTNPKLLAVCLVQSTPSISAPFVHNV